MKCSRCRKQKPAGAAANYVVDPALEALKAGHEIPWQEVIDPASRQMYVKRLFLLNWFATLMDLIF